ncbi:hypothetical protein [Pectobacterium brasiliense]|uniref:hypothetical protein n=1 Tax=Pectobacterium brasiliense TaxID=180957 RepID=UPI0019691F2B|nr:hypothetical protein [Pectobacterium brasiliense]MBN3227494.1 hypothetical protein [Pectobacterium brasiliense]
MAELNINITGDFIDSFIYSGVLFTIDTNGRLCSYSWKQLIDRYFDSHHEFIEYKTNILDSRDKKNKKINNNITIYFDKPFLNKNQKGTCCELDVWSTDLDVKDNILYISSERGLESLPFTEEWNNGKVMKFNELIPVWKGAKVFGLSTGSWGRTILAAGEKGALEIINNDVGQLKKIGFKKSSETIINNDICLDCEWDSNSTMAILDGLEKKMVYLFNKITSDSHFKETKGTVEKKTKPVIDVDIEKIKNTLANGNAKNISQTEFQYSWFEGNTLCAVNSLNKKYIFNKNEWVEHSTWEHGEKNTLSRVKSIKSGSFIETDDDKLFRVKDGGKYLLSDDFTSWRVFSRSKSYQDRVHIVNDDHLQIKIFD